MSQNISDVLADPNEVNRVAKETFETVDADKSGFVDENELGIMMTKVANDCGVPAPKEKDIHEALMAMDTNKDGKISLEEFKVLVVEILKTLAEAEEKEKGEDKDKDQ